jgi:hypothetical protein
MRHRGNTLDDDDDDDDNKTLWRHFLPIIKMSQESRMCNKCWHFTSKAFNYQFSLLFVFSSTLDYSMHHLHDKLKESFRDKLKQ